MSSPTDDASQKHSESAHSGDHATQQPSNVRTPFSASPRIPKWRKYVHLYLPMIVAFILVFHGEDIAQRLGFSQFDRGNTLPIILASAIPTYLLGSIVYPPNRPNATPEQSIRFTRKNAMNRALVLLTYGRLFGTSFDPIFYGVDVLCSFAVDSIIGERPAGAPQRRSEFFVALLWVTGSWIFHQIIPFSTPVIGLFIGAADRTLWRTGYIALVDDVVGVLARPNIRSLRGKVTLVLIQAFTITSLNYVARSFVRRYVLAKMLQDEGRSAETL